MHGILGAIVGAGVGYFLIGKGRYGGFWIRTDLVFPFVIGVSLVSFGIATIYGDRLWIRDNYVMLPPDAPAQSRLSSILSLCIIVVGIATSAIAVLKHLQGT